jgi:predicted alpha/beta superfamily hydrolase
MLPKLNYFLTFCVLFAIAACSNTSLPKDAIPKHETLTIQSKYVDELRTINIWTPDNYQTSQDSFPVMYMADGGVKEDFPHIANTLSKLVRENKIKPLILVGIENTQRRRDLTGYTEVEKDKEIAPIVGGSEKFRSFIREELFPKINSKYRTTAEKSIIGESASGLFVMETFFLYPDMFDTYIAFDPSIWWNNHYLVRTATTHLAKFPQHNKRLWFAGSNTEDINVHTKALADTLRRVNIPNLVWRYVDEPNESHATIFRSAKEKAIVWSLTTNK